MDNINELRQKRAHLVDEMRALLSKSENESRDLSAEEQTEYARRESELDGLEARIGRMEDQRERERSLALAERGELREINPQSEGDKEYRKAFESYLRGGFDYLTAEQRKIVQSGFVRDAEQRDMSVGTGANGGYTVPQDFYGQLVNKLEEQSGVRQAGANVLRTATGNDLPIPRVTAHAAAAWLGEAAAVSIVDDTFATATLKAYKAHKAVKVSIELLSDTGVDLIGYLASELGRAIGRLEGDAFATGTSSSTTTPEGIVNKATVGKTAASATVLTGGEIIDLVHSVPVPYRAKASFLMNDGIVKVIRKFTDTTGQFLWQPGLQAGQPDSLLGYPIFIEPAMDGSPAANDKPIVFGDVNGYFIRDVDAFNMIRLNERYMDNMQVGFLGWHRTDGDLIDADAVRVLQMAAV